MPKGKCSLAMCGWICMRMGEFSMVTCLWLDGVRQACICFDEACGLLVANNVWHA